MRSQKRVRHIGKVRSLKNAAAGKWKIYRKHLEARKAWQKNAISTGHQYSSYILPPPPPKHRKIREPKQRSPEELRERQRLREQKRLEKKLAKQRASTSTLPETRKEKKLKEASSNVLQKVSTEQKTAARTIKSKNLMTKETGKTKRLMNEPESKHRCLKEERAVLADEPKVKSTSPAKTEQKESMKSEKAIKDQMEVCLSTKKTEGTRKEQKKKRNRRPDDDNFIPEHNAVKGETHEMNSVEVNADFTEIVGRRHKKKGRPFNEQQSKFDEFAVKAPNENGKTAGIPAVSLKSEKDQIKEPDKDDGEKKACNEGFDETVTPTIEGQNGAVESSEFKTGKVVDDIPFSTGKVKSSESLPGIDVKMKVCVPKELNMNVAKLPDEQLKLLDVANLNLNDTVTKNITYAKKAKHEVNVEKKEPVVLAPQRDKLSCVQPPRERIYKLLPRDVQFCVHMIEKHGEDYEAMAKDEGNVFRDSVKGIARKIRIFKESPQYEAYLKQKDE